MATGNRRCAQADMRINIAGSELYSISDAEWGVDRSNTFTRGAGGEPYELKKGSKNYFFNFTISNCELKEIFQLLKTVNPGLEDLTDAGDASVLAYFRDSQGVYCMDIITCFCFNKHVNGASLDGDGTSSFTVPVGKILFDQPVQ